MILFYYTSQNYNLVTSTFTHVFTCIATCKGVYPEEFATLTLAPCSTRRSRNVLKAFAPKTTLLEATYF